MNELEQLATLFAKFPGIGERQAKRFVYYLLKKDSATLRDLTERILRLKHFVKECARCQRFAELQGSLCTTCKETKHAPLMIIVEKDTDLDTIKRSDVFEGSYFVLGGLIPLLDENPEKRVRLSALKNRITNEGETLNEIILALSCTREGEYTDEFLRNFIRKNFSDSTLKISSLGRGLSTGTELEYADSETIKGALQNRAV